MGKLINRRRVMKLVSFIPGQDDLVKSIEKYRRLYQYPNYMLGRTLPVFNQGSQPDVVIFAAHSDDDVLGLGTILSRHKVNGDSVKVIFLTNGSADFTGVRQSWNLSKEEGEKRAKIRDEEAVASLSLIGIEQDEIYCLGYPDGGTQRYVKEMYEDVYNILMNWKPKKVYTHCIEGGHIDHDMTSYAVKKACKQLAYPNLVEWAEYNPLQPIGTKEIKFRPDSIGHSEPTIIDISEKEYLLKKRMLSLHFSQKVEPYFQQGEVIRMANLNEPEKELYKYCQIPNNRLIPLLRKVNRSIKKQTNTVAESLIF